MAPQVNAVPDSSLHAVLGKFFEAKTACDVEGTMGFVAPDLVCYMDATLGWDFDSYAALKAVFEQYMPTWGPSARSYASKILAGEHSALVHMVDTPELFGGELRILAAVDFADGKVVRWIDYWDSTAYDTALYNQFRAPADSFPADLRDTMVESRACPELIGAATTLHQAFAAADPAAAAAVMHTDIVLTDMALRTQVIGRIEVTRYLDRVIRQVPYGHASTLRHVVGGSTGGGFEWTAGAGAGHLTGITALELDAGGLMTGITSVYDSRQIDPAAKRALLGAAAGYHTGS
jgi:ketosteroid isomerase-like protein